MTTRGKLTIFVAVCAVAYLGMGGGVSLPWGSTATGPVAVLILEETADRSLLPESQLEILSSTELRAWAVAHCDKDADGQPQFRVIDKDADTTHMDHLWQDRIVLAKSKPLPYLAVSTGRSGAAGDLPLTVNETLKVLKKWGGE